MGHGCESWVYTYPSSMGIKIKVATYMSMGLRTSIFLKGGYGDEYYRMLPIVIPKRGLPSPSGTYAPQALKLVVGTFVKKIFVVLYFDIVINQSSTSGSHWS